ncbi:Calreticulin [Diplonema papillatum]|nr:Calreticulin [Diplonema papillatum]
MRVLSLALMALAVAGETYFKETFDGAWDKRWTPSAKEGLGKFVKAHSELSDVEGLKTSEDAKFYAISAQTDKEYTNKDKDLVVSFTVQHAQGIDCGGGYLKVMPKTDAAAFTGDSEYFMMFGPDICGYTKKIHLIFGYNGKNLLWKKEPKCESDKLTHLYTVIVRPDGTYEVQVDGAKKESGKLEDDWAFLEPKEIDDPSDKKPADWVDEAQMDDPEDKKPAGYDDIAASIPDPQAEKPEDWDEDEDGEWEAPTIPNPEYKGPWAPKKIPNPAYKGPWAAKKIANPEYKEDKDLYLTRKPLSTVGFDLWQVKSGTIFNNIIISDSVDEVKAFNDATWGKMKDGEKAEFEKAEAAAKKAADEAAASNAAAATEEEEEDED